MSENVTWDDYVDIRFLDDDSKAIVEYRDNAVYSFREGGGYPPFNLSHLMRDEEHMNWLRLASPSVNKQNRRKDVLKTMYSHFNELEAFTEKQIRDPGITRGFIWEIPALWYAIRTPPGTFPFHNGRKGDCFYTRHAPGLAGELGEVVKEAIQREHPHMTQFGVLHIRRGDTLTMCDTTLERMSRYLACSLGDLFARGAGNTALYLMSDEQDSCYRQAIQAVVERLGLVFVDLDQKVWSVLEDQALANPARVRLLHNFFAFQVGQKVREGADFFMMQRRKMSCHDCDNITLGNTLVGSEEKPLATSTFLVGSEEKWNQIISANAAVIVPPQPRKQATLRLASSLGPRRGKNICMCHSLQAITS